MKQKIEGGKTWPWDFECIVCGNETASTDKVSLATKTCLRCERKRTATKPQKIEGWKMAFIEKVVRTLEESVGGLNNRVLNLEAEVKRLDENKANGAGSTSGQQFSNGGDFPIPNGK